jgi:hypothetical protein
MRLDASAPELIVMVITSIEAGRNQLLYGSNAIVLGFFREPHLG